MQYTYPPVQWVMGVLSRDIIQPGLDADDLPPSTAKVQNKWDYTSTPPVTLGMNNNIFTFTFTHKKVELFPHTPSRHRGRVEEQLHSFLTLALDR
jgi:hypothetical protein